MEMGGAVAPVSCVLVPWSSFTHSLLSVGSRVHLALAQPVSLRVSSRGCFREVVCAQAMSRASLKMMFEPKTVAVIGASDKEGKVGNIVMKNMLQAGYSGAVLPITKTNKSVCGVLAYPDYTQLPCVPDLAVLCTPAPTVLNIIKEIAAVGTKAAIILAAGLTKEHEKEVVEIAKANKAWSK